MSFFRRFYLKKTIIDYDPDYMLCACIFLGFKIAQLNVNLDVMVNVCPFLKLNNVERNMNNIQIMFEYEFYLINVLNYDFYVFSPYKAKMGLLYEIKNSGKEGVEDAISMMSSNDFDAKVNSFIDYSFYSDILFLYSYSQIALSCIFMVAELSGIDTEIIRYILDLDSFMRYDHFYHIVLPAVKNAMNTTTILNNQEFIDRKKKILLFLKNNPKYSEKLEKDREYLILT
jgi:hypothetical protein